MKILLTAINAKYIHSNYAVRCLKAYLESHTAYQACLAEYTINHDISLILKELYEQKPDILGFSCYIWNIEYVKELSVELKKLLPDTVIVWGGPEVSFQSEAYLGRYADHIVCGEGELAFASLVSRYGAGERPEGLIEGQPVTLDEIPFVYPELDELAHRILYYESSRGCPFRCQYCLSSVDKRVHFQSLERTLRDFDLFLEKKVPQVKLIDRTFNCDKERTKALWRHLIAHDNGVTNFHFEIAGELLDEECLALLSHVRPGFFQLEIGVQSTNRQTLRQICRSGDLERLFSAVSAIREKGNVHIHLDLIVGLPHEDIESFAGSFDTVYRAKPHQLQLGFLKVLKGSPIEAAKAEYGILHREKPPYEVLKTNWLSHDDLLRLKRVEDMVERYYNSGRYRALIGYLEGFFDSPFGLYDRLGEFYQQKGYHLLSISEVESYTVLYEFFKAYCKGDEERFGWLARFDLFSHSKAKRLPEWLSCNGVTPYLDKIRDFFSKEENRRYYPEYADETDPRRLMRILHLEVFPFDPRNGAEGLTPLLFRYRSCDILGNAEITKTEILLSD